MTTPATPHAPAFRFRFPEIRCETRVLARGFRCKARVPAEIGRMWVPNRTLGRFRQPCALTDPHCEGPCENGAARWRCATWMRVGGDPEAGCSEGTFRADWRCARSGEGTSSMKYQRLVARM